MSTDTVQVPTEPFSVYGCWPNERERFGEVFNAVNARSAEALMQNYAVGEGAEFWVCAVLDGEVAAVDGYTLYVDPADERNEDAQELVPDTAGPLADYTVLGIARDPSDEDAYDRVIGERYADTVPATSPGAAEDVARARIADKGGELWVCAVLEGVITRADRYATFVDPTIAEETSR